MCHELSIPDAVIKPAQNIESPAFQVTVKSSPRLLMSLS